MNKLGPDDRRRIGTLGEQLALEHLQQQNYEILAHNWRCKSGEIDIIAQSSGILVFVEVRTRRQTGSFGLAKESIDGRKQRQIRETTQFYLHQTKKYEQKIRFDVISVELNRDESLLHMEHICAAF